jgi:hypothetical protein
MINNITKNFSDLDVIEMCNKRKKSEIHKMIGSKLGYENSLSPHSLLDDEHIFDYKDLMKKDIHKKSNPELSNLIAADLAKAETLEMDERNHPKIIELCESIGYTTNLVYDADRILDITYEVICQEMWYHETPLFILQEKKVLDVLHGLLVSSLPMRTDKFPLAPMGVPTPGSAHARPSARPPIDTSGNFPPHVSAESPSNISPNPSEVISEVSEP